LAKAIDILAQGIEKQSHNHEFYYRLAGYLARKGRMKEAAENFELALHLNFADHYLLFEFYPDLRENEEFMNLLEMYKPDQE
ncbi:MAG: hypothetical protein ACLFPE_13210, partial [Bacteroidales bacterium]